MKKTINFVLFGLLTLVLLTGFLSATVSAAPVTVTDIADLQAAINAAAPGDEIVLDLDSESLPATLDETVTINKELTIRSADPTNREIIYISVNARHFNVTGGPVTLSDLILDGGTTAGGIAVSGSKAELNTYNVIIQNCKFNTEKGANISGGGVLVQNGSIYTMHSGAISNNVAIGAGGGVYVTGKGSAFTLRGGLINDNRATNAPSSLALPTYLSGMGGGVGIATNASFIMYGGAISGNVGGSGSGGGGVGIDNATFLMDGGIIGGAGTGNIAESGGGVYIGNNSSFTMDSGSITGNVITGNGAGVAVNPKGGSRVCTFVMNGGSIDNNTASRGGGGVYVGTNTLLINTFTMNGGAISDNIAGEPNISNFGGGGVMVNGCSFTMKGGIIENNVAVCNKTDAGGFGGAVYLRTEQYNTNPGTFTMINGVMHNNTAAKNGGGIYNNNTIISTAVNITGGTISGNTAGRSGGGIYNNDTKNETIINIAGGTICDNTATDGGGIWSGTTNEYRTRVKVGANAVFFGNSGGKAFIVAEEDMAGYNSAVNAQASGSLPTPPFNLWNNYDIGYKPLYQVTYDANWPSGAGEESGSVPTDSNDYPEDTLVRVLANPEGLEKEGYPFLGWAFDNTASIPDFVVNDSDVTPEAFEITGNTVLYAVWYVDPIQEDSDKTESRKGSKTGRAYITGPSDPEGPTGPDDPGHEDPKGGGSVKDPEDAGTIEEPSGIKPILILSLFFLIIIPLFVIRRREEDEEEE